MRTADVDASALNPSARETVSSWSLRRWTCLVLAYVSARTALCLAPPSRRTVHAGNIGRSAGRAPCPSWRRPRRRGHRRLPDRPRDGDAVEHRHRSKPRRRPVDGRRVCAKGSSCARATLLARIDPRPFQVQLAQAEGQAAKDEAALGTRRSICSATRCSSRRTPSRSSSSTRRSRPSTSSSGALKSDQSQIDSAKLNLTYCRITAPITGTRRPAAGRSRQHRARRRSERPGRHHAGPADRGGLHDPRGQPADGPAAGAAAVGSLDVDAYNRDLNTRLATGSLLTVDNQIDPTTGTVKLKATFPNDDDALFPNQFVNARLLVDTLRGAVDRPDRGDPAQPAVDVRLRREARQHRGRAERSGPADRGRRHGHLGRVVARRRGRDRRRRQAAAGHDRSPFARADAGGPARAPNQ